MKKIIIILKIILLLSVPAMAETKCFLVKENNKIITQEGDCSARYNPGSTFKIALSLMGFDANILVDTTHPELPFAKDYADWLDVWKQPHNPTTWIKNSCVWYSQILLKKLGIKKFKEYVTEFDYGNKDFSKNNALTSSWLSSGSLKISAEEQTAFLKNVVDRQFSVSTKAYEMTKDIIFVDYLENGWKLYGKRGGVKAFGENREGGWFVGWIEKGERTIIFAHYVEQDEQKISAGGIAKVETKKKLLKIIQGEN